MIEKKNRDSIHLHIHTYTLSHTQIDRWEPLGTDYWMSVHNVLYDVSIGGDGSGGGGVVRILRTQ